MSLHDGHLKRKDLYLTNDVSFAAYLMLRGYELLGTVDEGLTNQNGRPIMYFGLMPTNDEILSAHSALSRVQADINAKYDEFENMYLAIPHDPNGTVNVKDFVRYYRQCFRALDEAIRKPQ
jgi:hypothetical protein